MNSAVKSITGKYTPLTPSPCLPAAEYRFANENTWDAEHGWNVLGNLSVRE